MSFTVRWKKTNLTENKKKQHQQQQKELRGRSETKEKNSRPKSMSTKQKRETNTQVGKTGFSIGEVKKLDNLYLKARVV